MKKEMMIILIIGLVVGFLIGMVIYNITDTDIPYYEEEEYKHYVSEAIKLEGIRLCLSDGLQQMHYGKENCLGRCWGENLEGLQNECVICLEEIESANSVISQCIAHWNE